MKTRNLIAVLALAVLSAALVSTGCAKKAAVQDPTKLSGKIIVLTHRTDQLDTSFKRYAEEFNKIYPNVQVEFEAPPEYAGTIRTRMSTQEYGDVLSMVTSPPIPEDFAKFYEPVGTKKDMFAKYDFLETNAQTYFGDYVYAFPLNANAGGLVYNKKVFEKAGITTFPKSSDEFYAMLQQIKDKTDAVPIYMNYPSKWTLTQWEAGRLAYAGDPNYANKMVHDDSPFDPGEPHYELYKVMYEVVKRGLCERDLLTSDWEASKQMMADGKIGVMNLGSWAVGQIKAIAANPDDVGYMPFPVSHNGQVFAEAALDYNLAVNKNSQNKAAAIAWATWFADKSGYALDNMSIPALKGAEYPSFLKSYQDLGVKFIAGTPAPAGEEGLFDKIDKEAEIGLWLEPQKIRIVDAAMGTSKETFDDIMKDWNARWAKARKTLSVTP
jgi:ABC-type glycerol-3-phosphate transport system substrate-binding protein